MDPNIRREVSPSPQNNNLHSTGQPPSISSTKGIHVSELKRDDVEGATKTMHELAQDNPIKEVKSNIFKELKDKITYLISKKSIKFATSNVGLDGGLGLVQKYLIKYTPEKYLEIAVGGIKQTLAQPASQADNKKGIGDRLNDIDLNNLKNKTISTFKKNLDSIIKKDNFNTLTESDKSCLHELTEFLKDHENCKDLVDLLKDDNYDPIPALGKINEFIFILYNVAKIHDQLGKKEGDLSGIKEHVDKTIKAHIKERAKEITSKDVVFTQELSSDSKLAQKVREIPSKKLFCPSSGMKPSLIIDTNRFEVQECKYGSLNKVGDKIKDKEIVCEFNANILNTDPNLSVIFNKHEDGSFSNDHFRAVLAYDKNTRQKVVLCSIHLPGYGIGAEPRLHGERYDDLLKIHHVIHTLAKENGASGIIVGGDFNSISEDVGEAKSPLNAMGGENYTRFNTGSQTNVAPPSFIQTHYPTVREVDHVFAMAMGENKIDVNAADINVSGQPIGDAKTQHLESFDHRHVKGKVKFSSNSNKLQPASQRNPVKSQEDRELINRFINIRNNAITVEGKKPGEIKTYVDEIFFDILLGKAKDTKDLIKKINLLISQVNDNNLNSGILTNFNGRIDTNSEQLQALGIDKGKVKSEIQSTIAKLPKPSKTVTIESQKVQFEPKSERLTDYSNVMGLSLTPPPNATVQLEPESERLTDYSNVMGLSLTPPPNATVQLEPERERLTDYSNVMGLSLTTPLSFKPTKEQQDVQKPQSVKDVKEEAKESLMNLPDEIEKILNDEKSSPIDLASKLRNLSSAPLYEATKEFDRSAKLEKELKEIWNELDSVEEEKDKTTGENLKTEDYLEKMNSEMEELLKSEKNKVEAEMNEPDRIDFTQYLKNEAQRVDQEIEDANKQLKSSELDKILEKRVAELKKRNIAGETTNVMGPSSNIAEQTGSPSFEQEVVRSVQAKMKERVDAAVAKQKSSAP